MIASALPGYQAAANIARNFPNGKFCFFNVASTTDKILKKPLKKTGTQGVGADTSVGDLVSASELLAGSVVPPINAHYWGISLHEPLLNEKGLALCILDIDAKRTVNKKFTTEQLALLGVAKGMGLMSEISHSGVGAHIFITANAAEPLPAKVPAGELGADVEIFGLETSSGKSVMLTDTELSGVIDNLGSVEEILKAAGLAITQSKLGQEKTSNNSSETKNNMLMTGLNHTDKLSVKSHVIMHNGRSLDINHLRSALNFLGSDDYETWIDIGHYLYSLGDLGFQLWSEYGSTCPYYDHDQALAKWHSIKTSNTDPRGVFKRAMANGWPNPAKNNKKSSYSEFEPQIKTSELLDGHFWRELEFDGKFEPTEYLLDEFLAESFGILAGQPGIGKTSLIVEMMLIVGGFGKAMTSELTCHHPRKVIIVSEEISQIKRLLKAYSNEFAIDVKAINDRIKLIPAKRVDKFNLIKLATNVDTHTMGVLRPWLILDTASATMAIDDENNNSEVSSFVSALKENIFEGMKAPITIATHTAKTNGTQKSDSTARGGGAFEGDATLTSTYYMSGDIRILKLRKKRYSSLFNAVRIESKLVILSGTDRYNDLQSQSVYITKMYPMSDLELLATTKEARDKKDLIRQQTHSSVRQAILNQVKSRWEAGLNNSGRLALNDLKSTGLPKHVIEDTFRELKDEGWLIEVSIPKHVQAKVYGRANKQIGIFCHSEHHQIGSQPTVDEVSLFLNRLKKSQVD
jgi:hypothetical protein